MYPMIDHNDYVIINKVYDNNHLDGKIVAVRNDEGITLKMLKLDHKKKISVLFPVNKKFEPIFLDESHIIIGTLSLLYRRFE
jgi:SOS-response transcriptional repressor LexA